MFEVADGLGKTGEEFGSVWGFDGVEEWVFADIDGIEKCGPPIPGCNPLLVRFSCGGFRAGIFCIHAERKDSISGGIGAIAKDCGSCEGREQCRRWVSSVSVR